MNREAERPVPLHTGTRVCGARAGVSIFIKRNWDLHGFSTFFASHSGSRHARMRCRPGPGSGLYQRLGLWTIGTGCVWARGYRQCAARAAVPAAHADRAAGRRGAAAAGLHVGAARAFAPLAPLLRALSRLRPARLFPAQSAAALAQRGTGAASWLGSPEAAFPRGPRPWPGRLGPP